MTTNPNTCRECRTAPATDLNPDSDTCGCCGECAAYIDHLMSGNDHTDGPGGWWPGVEADHPDWY